MEDRTIKRLNKRWSSLEKEFSTWRSSFLDIQETILPRRGRFLLGERNDGRRRGTHLVDTTAMEANDVCAAGMLTGLMSPARPWVAFGIEGRMNAETHEENVALDRWRDLMMLIFQASDVYGSAYNLFLESSGFGTACGILYPDFDTVVRLHVHTAGEYRLNTDHTGRVVEVMTETEWLAEDIVSEFYGDKLGKDDLENLGMPHQLLQAFKRDPMTEMTVRHYIGPNTDDSGPIQQKGKAYVSEYWLTSKGSNHRDEEEPFIGRRGFSYNPIIAPRWQRMGRDAYGRGPGMNALADALMLQAMEKNNLRALEYMVRPALQGPAWTRDRKSDLRPGSFNPLDVSRSVGMDRVESIWEPSINFQHIEGKEERIRDGIRRKFYNHVFSMFMDRNMKDVREMALAEMSDEKLLQLGPIVTSHVIDMLDPLIEGTFTNMENAGLLGDVPESLSGERIQIQYISILAQAQRAQGINSIDRLMTMVANASQVKPGVLDRISDDDLVDVYAEQLGTPARLLVPVEDAKALREAREQAAQQDRAVAQAREGAAAAKDLGQVQIGADGNAAEEMLKGVAG